MAITNPTKPFTQHSRPRDYGPEALFALAVLTALAALALALTALPGDLALPAISMLLLSLAGVATLVAWACGRGSAQGRVTYWDVAGALTLIGISAATLVDPDQLVRIVEGPYRDK